MVEWFNNLSVGNKIAAVAAGAAIISVFLTIIGWFFKWLLGNKGKIVMRKTKVVQKGNANQVILANGNGAIAAGGDVGIKPELHEIVLKQLGRAEEKIASLEEQLSNRILESNTALDKSTPVPSAEAKKLADLITEDDGPYALALKAIAEGESEKADCLLGEIQQILDAVQQEKDETQIKIFTARMLNASYAGRHQDALEYCNKLKPLVGDDSRILNNMAVVFFENAKYKEADSLMQRVIKINEAIYGMNHPRVAIALNNLAQLLEKKPRLHQNG